VSKSTFGLPASRITDFTYGLGRIIDLARSVTALECRDRLSGHFVVADANTGNVLLSLFSGESPAEEASVYFINAHEKAERVRAQMISYGHIFSRQSRNPDQNQWGGSVIAGDYILSFSGFPENVDEAMMVVLGIAMGLFDGPIDLNEQLFAENPAIAELYTAWQRSKQDEGSTGPT